MFHKKIDKTKCAELADKFESLNSLVKEFMEQHSGTYFDKIELPFAKIRKNLNIEFDAKMRGEEVRLLNDLDEILEVADAKAAEVAFKDFVATASGLKEDIELLLVADPIKEHEIIYHDVVKRLTEIIGPSSSKPDMKP